MFDLELTLQQAVNLLSENEKKVFAKLQGLLDKGDRLFTGLLTLPI